MSIYLEVTNGKYAASTVALEEGDVCRVGRGAKMEVYLPDDFALAESHFLLTFASFIGCVIDSGSQTGTFLNGERVLAAEIEKISRISAG
jgi:pSer/pThr/pTyr-binding forkhead associated (FHA) protein